MGKLFTPKVYLLSSFSSSSFPQLTLLLMDHHSAFQVTAECASGYETVPNTFSQVQLPQPSPSIL